LRDVAIIGAGMTKFGRWDDKSLIDLIVEASLKALDHAGAYKNEIGSVYMSTMLAGELTHQCAVASALTVSTWVIASEGGEGRKRSSVRWIRG